MSPRAESESNELVTDASNFAAWYRNLLLEHPERQFELFRSLRDVIDKFQSLRLVDIGDNTRIVKAVFKANSRAEGAPQEFECSLTELSEGQRVLLVLYTLLYCELKRGGILCIDEPDNFVALREIQPWLLELVDRADDNDSQVLLISHHPELINYLAAEHGVIFERLDGGPVRVRPFEVDAESGLSAAETVALGWEHE
jgi:predicted ATPase